MTFREASVIDDYIVQCERACWKLPAGKAAQLRAEVVGTLKSAKPPKSNINTEERKALKQLQRETSIQILAAADKGRATVIMDITEYDEN